MNSTPQLPSKDDPHHPLNLIPIPELEADYSNFNEWSHAARFHLGYHKLMGYTTYANEMIEPSTAEEREIQEMHSLHAYSLIASKVEKIGPEFENIMGRHLFRDKQQRFHFDPRRLWADIHLFSHNVPIPRA